MPEPDVTKIAERVAKLLALAEKGASEAEAASAVSKAMALLAAHNISMDTVTQAAEGSGRREDAKQRGGMYLYEREVYKAVAELNFCFYFVSRVKFRLHPAKLDARGVVIREARHQMSFAHRIVGRAVNVAASKAMSGYLLGTIERLCRERIGNVNSQFFSSWSVSFRKGAAERVVEKLRERRWALVEKETQEREKAEAVANEAVAKGASTATTMTLASVAKREKDANIDFMHGEGTAARWAAERAETAKANREAEEEWTAWCVAHPEEAAKMAREERARERRNAARRTGSYRSPARERGDPGGYAAGREAGRKIGLDQQAGAEARKRVS